MEGDLVRGVWYVYGEYSNGAMDDLMIHYQTIPLLVLIKTTSISLLIPQGPPTQLRTVSDE